MRITSEVIGRALGRSPREVSRAIADGFRPVDRSSAMPGAGRDWSDRDLVRLVFCFHLMDIGLDLGVWGEIPALDGDDDFAVVSVFNVSGIPDYRVRAGTRADIAAAFAEHDAPAYLIICLDSVRAEARKITSLRGVVA